MKNSSRFLGFVLTIATLLLSACGGTAATSTVGGGNVEPIPVAFIGTVDSLAGDQWVINGQTVTVPPEAVQDGPFAAGDQVKVEGSVNADGSFRVSKVGLPTPQDASSLPQFGDDNSNDSNSNTNDANANDSSVNSNDDNGNAANANDDNGNDANTNDDNGDGANSNNDDGGNDNSDDGNSNDDDDNDDDRNDNGDDDDDNGNDD